MAGETLPRTWNERQQVGGGVGLAQHLEHLFAAAHAGEPVVDKHDAGLRLIAADHFAVDLANALGGAAPRILFHTWIPRLSDRRAGASCKAP